MRLPRWAKVVLLGLMVSILVLVLVVVLLSALGPYSIVHDRVPYVARLPCERDSTWGMLYKYEDVFLEGFLEWSPDGTQIVFNDDLKYMYVVDPAGTYLRPLFEVTPFEMPTYGIHADVSPDGARIVYSTCQFSTGSEHRLSEMEKYSYEIAVANLDGTGIQRLTENRDIDHFPVWSSDGKRIAFISTRHRNSDDVVYIPTNAQLYTMEADGSNVVMIALSEHGGAALLPPVWSPDGEYLAFVELGPRVNVGERQFRKHFLLTARVDGTDRTRIAAIEPVPPSWSPDGRFIVFVRAEHPRGVYTVRPDGTDLQQVVYWNAVHVSWSPDGSALLIISEAQELYVIQRDGKGLRKLNVGSESQPTSRIRAAWSPDSERIAVYTPGNPDLVPEHVILPKLYTVERDGSDRRDLVLRDNDGNLVPANPPEDES